jgi:RNA polymerase sigma-70 factor, ECF subfamily
MQVSEEDRDIGRTDEELLRSLKQGDEAAFTVLYRRRQAGIFRFALHMTGDLVVAEDVTQEVFLALLSGTARFDPARGPLSAFLFGVARHQVLKRLGRKREVASEEDCGIDEELLDGLVREEVVDQVRRAVLSLPPTYREAVVLCDLEESSYENAAVALDCPVGTVRSRLSRGRAMLAQKLRTVAAGQGRK